MVYILGNVLDFEQTASFKIQISVSDGSDSVIVYVTIVVEPANDNSPFFSSATLPAISLAEDTPMGHLVTTVTATDNDKDNQFSNHGDVVYTICDGIDALG